MTTDKQSVYKAIIGQASYMTKQEFVETFKQKPALLNLLKVRELRKRVSHILNENESYICK
jgi:hypothetical protein